MQLDQDYFTLLGQAITYEIDKASIDEHYIALQQQFHPDKFGADSAQEQLLAAQVSAMVNDAQRVLKDEVLRAEYLLKLHGNSQNLEDATLSDGAFLMAQMELREQMEMASTEAAMEDFMVMIEAEQAQLSIAFGQQYESDLKIGFTLLQKMKFFQRLLAQAEEKLEDLAD